MPQPNRQLALQKHLTTQTRNLGLCTYKTCTRSGIACDKGYLICWFIHGLDNNINHTKEFLDCGVLPWYDLTRNDVIIQVTDIKMNKMSTGTWLTTPASANDVGQQGAKHPAPITDTVNTIPVDHDLPEYLYKASDLYWSEVWKLLK